MTGRRSAGRQSTAVMANRAPRTVEDLDPQRARWRALDFFPTPPWAARAGLELIMSLEGGSGGTVWEPACGQGHMAAVLGATRDTAGFGRVLASDIEDYGRGYPVHDFLSAAMLHEAAGGVDWVVTNPPFKLGAEFARRGLEVARCGVALLLRLSFLESVDRYELLFGGETPVSVVAPFAERVPMQLGSWEPKLATATAYAWFIWRKRSRWGVRPELSPIPPGTKRRLSLPEDVRRWAEPATTPLFEAQA